MRRCPAGSSRAPARSSTHGRWRSRRSCSRSCSTRSTRVPWGGARSPISAPRTGRSPRWRCSLGAAGRRALLPAAAARIRRHGAGRRGLASLCRGGERGALGAGDRQARRANAPVARASVTLIHGSVDATAGACGDSRRSQRWPVETRFAGSRRSATFASSSDGARRHATCPHRAPNAARSSRQPAPLLHRRVDPRRAGDRAVGADRRGRLALRRRDREGSRHHRRRRAARALGVRQHRAPDAHEPQLRRAGRRAGRRALLRVRPHPRRLDQRIPHRARRPGRERPGGRRSDATRACRRDRSSARRGGRPPHAHPGPAGARRHRALDARPTCATTISARSSSSPT